MHRERLDIYEKKPFGMDEYLANNGWHFSKKMCEFAVSLMEWKNQNGEKEKLPAMSKDDVDAMLTKYGVTLKNKIGYDYVYVANMCKADFLKSSVPNEQYQALYIKDTIDDPDGYDGKEMTRWYADTIGMGIPVMWSDLM
jgi:hypothetical protein|nr:MAG TPA: hypothetical protein [Caudoviricetes sp.]